MEKLYKKLFIVLVLCLPPSLLMAQSLTGKITDQSGSALPGVKMHIQGLTTTITNSEGAYYFKLPSRGSYRLKISGAGFQSQTQDVYVKDKTGLSNYTLQPEGVIPVNKALTGTRTMNAVSSH